MSKLDKKGTVLTFANVSKILEHIEEIILFNGMLIILFDSQFLGERNVICYNISGNIVWTIATPIRIHEETYYVGMTIQNEKLLVYSKDGVEYDVSLETGLFNRYELVK